MNITIVGTGYVGLVAGICFAEKSNNLICAPVDPFNFAVAFKNSMIIDDQNQYNAKFLGDIGFNKFKLEKYNNI